MDRIDQIKGLLYWFDAGSGNPIIKKVNKLIGERNPGWLENKYSRKHPVYLMRSSGEIAYHYYSDPIEANCYISHKDRCHEWGQYYDYVELDGTFQWGEENIDKAEQKFVQIIKDIINEEYSEEFYIAYLAYKSGHVLPGWKVAKVNLVKGPWEHNKDIFLCRLPLSEFAKKYGEDGIPDV